MLPPRSKQQCPPYMHSLKKSWWVIAPGQQQQNIHVQNAGSGNHHCVQPNPVFKRYPELLQLKRWNPLTKHRKRVWWPTVSWTNQDTRDMTALKGSTEQDPLLGQCRSPLPQHLWHYRAQFLHGVPDHTASPYQTKTRRLLPILTEGWNSRHSSSKSGSTWWKESLGGN